MSVLDKYKDSLSPEDFAELEESITSLVDEKAKMIAEALVSEETARIEGLAEEFTERELAVRLTEAVEKIQSEFDEKTERFKLAAIEKIEAYAEEYISEQVNEITEAKLAALDEEYNLAVKELEETVVSDLDRFLDIEISSKISDSLLETVAINETFKPIVNGIMSLFESNFVSLSTDSQSIVKAAESKAESYKSKLNESYSVKLALQEKIDALETNLLITNRTQNLTETNKMKVRAMFEGKGYTEVEKKIGTFIEVLEERDMLSEVEDVTNDDIFIAENEEETVVEDTTTINESEDDSLKIRLEKINEYL